MTKDKNDFIAGKNAENLTAFSAETDIAETSFEKDNATAKNETFERADSENAVLAQEEKAFRNGNEGVSRNENARRNENDEAQETQNDKSDGGREFSASERERLGKLITDIIDRYVEKANNLPPKVLSGASGAFVPAPPKKPKTIDEATEIARGFLFHSER